MEADDSSCSICVLGMTRRWRMVGGFATKKSRKITPPRRIAGLAGCGWDSGENSFWPVIRCRQIKFSYKCRLAFSFLACLNLPFKDASCEGPSVPFYFVGFSVQCGNVIHFIMCFYVFPACHCDKLNPAPAGITGAAFEPIKPRSLASNG